jgi:hypothetical protein
VYTKQIEQRQSFAFFEGLSLSIIASGTETLLSGYDRQNEMVGSDNASISCKDWLTRHV